MAYLRDTDHFVNGRDMLTEAGGKYLERREIMNIFSQHLRKLYPGIDVSAIKKEQDKYKLMKTCNFKGCNRSFADGKALMAHRKTDHPVAEGRKHDHSHRQYTCPERGCHRKKRSKGFPTALALREHQIKMQHWGNGTFHGEDGSVPVDAVLEGETLEDAQAAAGAADDGALDELNNAGQNDEDDDEMDPDTHEHSLSQGQNQQQQLSVPQQPLPNTEDTLFPLIEQEVTQLRAQAQQAQQAQQNMMPIDPAMQSTPVHNQQQDHGMMGMTPQSSYQGGMQLDDPRKRAAFERYQQLQQEMQSLQKELFN
jgi:hypothetical protein